MDTLATQREVVKQTLLEYARLRPSHGEIRLHAVFDADRDHYALIQVGWDRGRRVKGLLIYITLRDGKVVVEYDGLEHTISEDLTQRGIAEEQIVLAFLPESSVASV